MLAEAVEIWTSEPSVHRIGPATLVVGFDELPRLMFSQGAVDYTYYNSTLPRCWSLRPLLGHAPGSLLGAWREIDAIKERLKAAEREVEQDERDQAQQREADNRTAQEIDERREEEHGD